MKSKHGMVLTSTPAGITPEIVAFCRQLSPEPPVYVSVEPSASATPRECYGNVAGQVARYGGGTCHGWIIWAIPGVLLEAEFHAVWRSPEGQLLDVTPQVDGEERLLFVPDPVRVFTGARVPSVKLPLVDDPRVAEFLRASDNLKRSGPAVDPVTLVAYQTAHADLTSLTYEIAAKTGRNDPCYCGSGKKRKKCCG